MKKAMALLAVLATYGCAAQTSASGGKSQLDQDPKGWVDLFPGRDFKGWKRVPIDPLTSKEVWRLSEDGTSLFCDARGGIKELLMNDEERADGIFHVEWRWGKDQGEKPNYNGGIYLRSAPDGKTWIQAQVARQEKGPVVGDFIGMLLEEGKPKRTDLLQKGPSREAPLGDWNTYEITCKGDTITLWVNGGVTAVWEHFPIARGHLALQAEFALYEFRCLKYKALP